MERERTDMVQTTPSPESEAGRKIYEKPNVGYPNPKLEDTVDAGHVQEKVLPFCFVKVGPQDTDAKCIIQDAVRLFEEMDQRHFQISEKIREKVYDREGVVSRLKNLKNYYLYRLNGSVDGKKDLLTHLYMALDSLSFPKSCSSEEKLGNHKLNFRMLHKTKNLAQEKQIFREINMSQQRNNASTSLMAELRNILWEIQSKYKYYHHHFNQKYSEKVSEEIKQFEVTRKIPEGLRETMRNQVKIICDELMVTRKKKRALETKIRLVEKELEAINEEIWSFQKHLKEKHHRKEACLFILQENKFDDCWILKYCNLEYDSMHLHTIYWEKSSLSKNKCHK